jgi:hypothetical protein
VRAATRIGVFWSASSRVLWGLELRDQRGDSMRRHHVVELQERDGRATAAQERATRNAAAHRRTP